MASPANCFLKPAEQFSKRAPVTASRCVLFFRSPSAVWDIVFTNDTLFFFNCWRSADTAERAAISGAWRRPCGVSAFETSFATLAEVGLATTSALALSISVFSRRNAQRLASL